MTALSQKSACLGIIKRQHLQQVKLKGGERERKGRFADGHGYAHI